MSIADRFRDLFSDRRRVLIGAAVVGGGLGLIAVARRSRAGANAAAQQHAASPGAVDPNAIPVTPYTSFGGVDNSMADSANAEAIMGTIGQLDNTVAGVIGALGGIASTVDGLTSNVQGLQQLVNDRPAPPAATVVAPAVTTTATTTVATTTTGTGAADLPRWTPAGNVKVGDPVPHIAGAAFAGRVKLTNGQYAPIVKYKNGTSQIDPGWQAWMRANKVSKA